MNGQLQIERRLRCSGIGLEVLSQADQDENACGVSMEDATC